MSTVQLLQTTLRSVAQVPGVLGYLAVSREENFQSPEMTALPKALSTTAAQLARKVLDGTEERQTEVALNHRVVMRRIGDCVACVIAEMSTTDAELHRKLNVIAIRTQVVSGGGDEVSPVAGRLKEAYVAVGGPLSELAFDRAMEQLKVARKATSSVALRELVESLGASLTPAYKKTEFLTRGAALIDEHDALFASHTSMVPPPNSSIPPRSERISVAPRSDSPKAKLSHVAVAVLVARDLAGPGVEDSLVRAVANFERLDAASATLERLLTGMSQALPELSRARFVADARAAVDRQR